MKLISREADRLVFRLSKREHDALLVALRLRPHLAFGTRSLASDTPKEERLVEAQADLADALKEHREELTRGIEALLASEEKCAPQKNGGYRTTFTTAEIELLLQALNEVRVGAWEKLGRPDFETGDRPEISEENFLCFWAFQVTDLFQGTLLAALAGEEAGEE